MITKKTIGGIEFTVADDEQDLWAIEEPPEPVITVTVEPGEGYVVYGDDNASHHQFEYKNWPRMLYGDDGMMRDEAIAYAKRWAQAVRGVYEEI